MGECIDRPIGSIGVSRLHVAVKASVTGRSATWEAPDAATDGHHGMPVPPRPIDSTPREIDGEPRLRAAGRD
jgi:hypothetical protein